MNEWRVGETRGCIGIKDASAELRAPPEMQLGIWDFFGSNAILSYLILYPPATSHARFMPVVYTTGHKASTTSCGACAKNIYKA